jgi:cytochrome b561
MEVAVIAAAGITIALIAVIRLFWRRRKPLQEP